jgi:hypothetical protein
MKRVSSLQTRMVLRMFRETSSGDDVPDELEILDTETRLG